MEDRPPSPIDKLTIPGRLLLIADDSSFGAGFYASFLLSAEFSPGRYPMIFVCMPICMFAFLLPRRTWILERLGVHVYAKNVQMNEPNPVARANAYHPSFFVHAATLASPSPLVSVLIFNVAR